MSTHFVKQVLHSKFNYYALLFLLIKADQNEVKCTLGMSLSFESWWSVWTHLDAPDKIQVAHIRRRPLRIVSLM